MQCCKILLGNFETACLIVGKVAQCQLLCDFTLIRASSIRALRGVASWLLELLRFPIELGDIVGLVGIFYDTIAQIAKLTAIRNL